MAVLRVPSLRYVFGNAAPCLRLLQRRHAQVHDVRFLVTHPQSQRVTDRYQHKLQQKAREEGFKDVDELKAVYQDKIQSQRKQAVAATPSSSSSTYPSQPPPNTPKSPYPAPPPAPQSASPTSPPRTTKTTTPPGIKTLSSFIDIHKTLELPQREIEYIWRLRHASNLQSLCAVIIEETYSRIEATARRHPQFILPLPREERGAEIHFLQWTFPTPDTATVLFTNLAEFKLRGEYAVPHTTVTHHLDLRKEKGLVLLQGSVVEGRGVTVEEAKWLLMCLQKFYGGEGEKVERKRLLEKFSGGDEGFRVEELLEEAENIV